MCDRACWKYFSARVSIRSLSYSSVIRPPYWTTAIMYLMVSHPGAGAFLASISTRWFCSHSTSCTCSLDHPHFSRQAQADQHWYLCHTKTAMTCMWLKNSTIHSASTSPTNLKELDTCWEIRNIKFIGHVPTNGPKFSTLLYYAVHECEQEEQLSPLTAIDSI